MLYERIMYRRVTHHEVNEWVKQLPLFKGHQLNGYYGIPRWGEGGLAVLYYENGRNAFDGLFDEQGRPARYTVWNEDGTVEEQLEFSYWSDDPFNATIVHGYGPEWLWGARDQK